MTRLAPFIFALGALAAGPGVAAPCDTVDPEFRAAARAALEGAEDARIARLAGYLNDAFYTDLTCRLDHRSDEAARDRMLADPELLLENALTLTAPRNQSDALMLILMAMQATVDE